MNWNLQRRKTRRISVGDVPVGGAAPITVQSMTNTFTQDVSRTVQQILRLEDAGCEIVRVAVPDMAAANAIRAIRKQVHIPVIADIHFDHRLAIAAVSAGADGLRINPGNIGPRKRIRSVVKAAQAAGIPMRIGVNAGSLEKTLLRKHGGATPAAMVESALNHVDLLGSMGFDRIKISLKASDVPRTVTAYRLFSEQSDLPLHLGVTEAGTLYAGAVKSSLGIGMLLAEGIGDTLRVSLTRDPVDEVRVGYEILKALEIRQRGPEIISCPTCGRCGIDLFGIVDRVEAALTGKSFPVKIAIMGCVVNGPGEAKEADIGVAGGDGLGILFRKGNVVKKFPEEKLVDVLMEEIDRFEKESQAAEKRNGHKREAQHGKTDENSHFSDSE